MPRIVPELQIRQRAAPSSAAPARDADTGDSPVQLAQAVFDVFHAACAELVAKGQAGDGLAWRNQLQASLDDDRLLNIAARAHFEFYVGRLLANGWQSGHESLFPAARRVFGWEKDRRRLDEFGQLGAWLNQAIDEYGVFEQQDGADSAAQADAILRVREAAEPDTRELVQHAPHLRNMAERFPAWTAIIASTQRIGEWLVREEALPKWRRRKAKTAAVPSGSSSDFNWWGVIWFMIMMVSMLSRCCSHSSAPPASTFNPPRLEQTAEQKAAEEAYQRAAGNLYMEPGTRKLEGSPYAPGQTPAPTHLLYEGLRAAPAAPQRPPGRAPNAAEVKAIGERVQFEWPHVEPRLYKVEYLVDLDDHGAVSHLSKRTGSGLAALDQRVEEAVRAAAPFGKEISRRFFFKYSWGQNNGHKAPPAPVQGEPEAPGADTPAEPAET